MRQECEAHYTSARDNQYRSTARYYKDSCPYCRIAELEKELARYKAGVEVKGTYYSAGMLGGRIMFHHTVEDVLDELFSDGQCVRALVMKEVNDEHT